MMLYITSFQSYLYSDRNFNIIYTLFKRIAVLDIYKYTPGFVDKYSQFIHSKSFVVRLFVLFLKEQTS